MLRKIQFVFLILFISNSLFAQQLYDSLLTELSTKYPQEKMYIQTDKVYYNPGETVWLKAYLTSHNFPGPVSTNIYVELIDAKNKILSRKIMPVIMQGAHFDFVIPDSTKSSRLYLRAYTTWMLNFNTDVYTKAVNVILPETPKAAAAKDYTVAFFPEGGDLVAGIESKVAFKTTDSEGNPFAISGTIVNEEGKTVTTFKSVHDGMGYFSINPEAIKRYKAIWKDVSGKTHETLIPNSKSKGATISLFKNSNGLQYRINRTLEENNSSNEYIVVGQMHQQVVYAARINFKLKTEITAALPTDSLEDGILQITLFNADKEPVSERLHFVNNNTKQFYSDIRLNSKNLQSKARNELQIDVGGELKSNLSVSITDDVQSPTTANGENILSYLLMSSDLQGYIHNPGYYFAAAGDSVSNNLDLVMLTNGWRRFNWKEIIAGKWPQINNMPDNYLSVEGNIYGLSSGELVGRSISGFLQTNKDIEATSFVSLDAGKDGKFKADKFYFFDTVKIYYQLSNDKNKRLTDKASFSFKTGFINSPNISAPAALSYAPLLPKAIIAENAKSVQWMKTDEDSRKIKVLENVSVTGKTKSKEEKLDEEYSSGMFSTSNAKIFVLEDDPSANAYRTVLDYLQGRVAGLQVSTQGFTGTVTRRGSPTSLFLNEMPTESDMIMSISLSDVAMIKVLDPPFIGAAGGGAGGAVVVYTKKGGSRSSNVKGLNMAILHGYSKFKEFYSPDYEKIFDNSPDLRTTLYWNPVLLLDSKNKRMVLPFFNNSKAKKIRVIVEGINEKGQLTREEKIFE